MKVYLISLGCPKNLTDSEVLMGKLVASGHTIVNRPAKADLIIINTCAFLKSARDEVKATVAGMKKYRKPIYLAGCYPQWNRQFHLPAGRQGCRGQLPGVKGTVDSLGLFNYAVPRIKATSPWYAYVKIAEGCNNCCSYCLIPQIRGKLKTRPVADIINEVKILAQRGAKEIIYVAQDTTAYPKFVELLRKTAKIKGLSWTRIMYAHPNHISDQLLEVMARERKIVKYLDLPIQHACDKILRLMNRRYTRLDLEKLISKIRRKIPKIALRTSVIVGFPGENEADFQELFDFIKKIKFDKLGVFKFEREEGTPAYKLRGQVSAKVKQKRLDRLMQLQASISKGINRKMIGLTLETIVEKSGSGRSYKDAPEIDGRVLIDKAKTLKPGQIIKVRICGAKTYDLVGFKT